MRSGWRIGFNITPDTPGPAFTRISPGEEHKTVCAFNDKASQVRLVYRDLTSPYLSRITCTYLKDLL